VLETLRICKDRDVLKKYLEEQEAAEIMFTWLDEQKAKRFEYEEIKQEARAEGIAEGRAKGRTEGEQKLSSLMTKLKDLGRKDDAFEAASNVAYREKLYRELNIQ